MGFYCVAVLAALAILCIFLIMPGNPPKNADERLWEYPYAHRGLHTRDQSVPENSLAAFMSAAGAGYGIELDLNLTADGKVVVFHDDNLLRICGVDKPITDCTYSELLGYRLCNTDEKIPLLSQVLACADDRVPLLIELKSTKKNDILCQKAAEQLGAYSGAYCIESFHPHIVRWFRKNAPSIVRGQLSAGCKEFSKIPRLPAFMLSALLTNAVTRPHFVAYKYPNAHRNPALRLFRFLGGKLAGWTARDADAVQYCRKHFDIIIFEYVEILKSENNFQK